MIIDGIIRYNFTPTVYVCNIEWASIIWFSLHWKTFSLNILKESLYYKTQYWYIDLQLCPLYIITGCGQPWPPKHIHGRYRCWSMWWWQWCWESAVFPTHPADLCGGCGWWIVLTPWNKCISYFTFMTAWHMD